MIPSTLALKSNGYMLSTAPERLGELVPSNPRTNIDCLREQYQSQGYLWLRGLLDRDAVLAFRRRYFAAFRHTGLLAEGSDPQDGIYGGGPVDRDAVHKVLMEVVRWAAYESFCLAEPIWQFYEAFFEGTSYLHKRKLVRHTLPNDPNCTGAHYDLVYLRGGTDHICTSWIPLGDTPIEMGGLIYLEGSDPWARQQEQVFNANHTHLSPSERVSAYNKNMTTGWLTKDLPTLAGQVGSRWLVADYAAGDMLIHSPYMIHAATMNMAGDGRMRLSTDIRYQRVRDEIDARWNNHWSLDDML